MIAYSIIVPAYQAAHVVPHCVAALRDQSLARDTYEIIVVDDGSTDATAAVAEKALLGGPGRVLRVPHGGPALARNAGARVAQGRVLLFTDADCEPAHDWLARMIAPFSAADISGVKGAYRTQQTAWVARFVQQEYQEKYDRMAALPTIDFIDTYAAAYRREVFLDSGGFDAAYTSATVEDQELSFRLAERGHRLVFAPDAIVFHRHVTAVWKYARRKYFIGYWKALLVRQHPGKIKNDSHTPQAIKVQMGLLALALIASAASGLIGALFVPALAVWLALMLSMLPLLSKIARRDPAIVLIAPLLISVRALALGLGLSAGLLHFYRRDRS